MIKLAVIMWCGLEIVLVHNWMITWGQKEFPPTKHFNDMFFREVNVHINEFPLIHSQPNLSEPTSATSPTHRRKGKVKGKSNVKDDALRKLATTIRNAFESVRSNHW